MTSGPRRLVLLCGVLPTLVVALLSLSRPPFFTSLEYGTYDRMLRAAGTRPPGDNVVIVDVDERSLSAIGQWPWRRDLVGSLIARLRDLGASTIALDLIFAEPDRSTTAGANPDEALARTLQQGGVVLGYGLTFDPPPGQAGTCVQHPIGLAIVRRGDDQGGDPFFEATGATCSLPILAQAARASGFLNAAPDPDGRLRRVPLLLSFNGRIYPALGLAAVLASRPPVPVSLRVINVNATSLQLGDRSVPLDGKSDLMLRYRGRNHRFAYVSAAEVLAGQQASSVFKDKIVFVGTTALGTRDVVSTPVDSQFAGVEVQATVADNLLQDDFIHRPEHAVALETLVVLGLGVAAALAVGRFGFAWGAAGVTASMLMLWTGAIALMSETGAFLSPLYPTLALIAAFVAMAVAGYTLEHRRADKAGQERAVSQKLMVQALLSLTEVRDAETGSHSRRTQEYTRILARQLARNPAYSAYLTPERIDQLATLAPLHDIGKVGVPDRLLNKPGALTADELQEMRKHPAHGRDVIAHAERDAGAQDDTILKMAKEIVYTHHEKWDGTGYPQGLRGANIPIAGRLMALVDVYDAVTSRRLYREPMSHDDAVAFIVSGRGTHFDPSIVDAFVAVSARLKQFAFAASAG